MSQNSAHTEYAFLLRNGRPLQPPALGKGPATPTMTGAHPKGAAGPQVGLGYGSAPLPPTHYTPASFDEDPGPFGRYRVTLQEGVHGNDDRQLVADPSAWPWRVHGHLLVTFPNQRTYTGTGTLIGQRHVLTAGHNLFAEADGGWATSVLFTPAQSKTGDPPFGSFWAEQVLCCPQWTRERQDDFDFGMIVLAQDAGTQIGWYGLRVLTDQEWLGRRVVLAGYPIDKDKDGWGMWWNEDVVAQVSPRRVTYSLATFAGESGTGVFANFAAADEAEQKVLAIHTSGENLVNSAVRMTLEVYNQYQRWLSPA